MGCSGSGGVGVVVGLKCRANRRRCIERILQSNRQSMQDIRCMDAIKVWSTEVSNG